MWHRHLAPGAPADRKETNMTHPHATAATLKFWTRGLTFTVLAFAIALTAQPAAAGADAEKFMQSLIDRGFSILRDNSAGDAARKSRFHDFVVQNVDAEKTALFALGQYRRGASSEDLATYVTAFRDYITAIYETRLEERQTQDLRVVGSIENKPGDVTVSAEAKDPSSPNPVKIAFRLLGSNGNYKVVDVQVSGIWISIDQRDQFTTFLSKGNGDVKALTADLTRRAGVIRAGKNG
jgi:phospholipid transport system substrate-binding protein